jgi:BolA family transcriptional regulator, general stress-responsive regulator
MKNRADRMADLLREQFEPDLLQIVDESARHAGHAGAAPGGETHFRVVMVAARFRGVSRVERSRQVHAALKAEFTAGLHALALRLLTPEERGGDATLT